MSRIKLDLSHFKHVKSNDKTTTLQHKDGHTLDIVHNALHPEAQAQLQALAKAAKQYETPLQADEAQHQSKMADGGDVKDDSSDDRYHADAPPPQSLSEGWKNIKNELGFAGGGLIKNDTDYKGIESVDKTPPKNTLNYKELKKEHKVKQRSIDAEEALKKKPVQQYAGGALPVSTPMNQDEAADQGDAGAQAAIPSPTSVPDAAPTPAAEPTQQQDPALESKRQLYNQMLTNTKDPMLAKDRMFGPNGEAPKNFDSSYWQAATTTFDRQQKMAQEDTEVAANKAVQENAMRQQAGLPPIPVPTVGVNQQGLAPVTDTSSTNQGIAPPADETTKKPTDISGFDINNPTAEPEGMMRQGYAQNLAGVYGQAEAQGALGQVEAQKLQAGIDAQTKAQNAFRSQFDNLNTERQNLVKDIQTGYINPDKYWTGDPQTGQGGHSKIAAGIGMILAGFNPTSAPNAAEEYLKFQMGQNMQAQAQNLNAKNNLLAHNLMQFGNLRDAFEFTRIQNNDVLSHQLQQAAASAASPLAQSAALQTAGKFQMESAGLFQQFAMRRAMMGLASGAGSDPNTVEKMISYMSAVNPEQAKIYRDAYVPGIGISKSLTPVPQPIRDKITTSQNLNRLLGQAQQLAAQKGTATDWNQLQGGETLIREITSTLRTAEDQGVYKESDAKFLKGMLGTNPAAFSAALTSSPKLKQLMQIKQADFRNLLMNSNLPIPQDLQQSATPQQSQQPILGKDGRYYVRKVINGKGYMVP